ncbi:C45 family autoproteolytic acyltransferase/hydolase [Oceanobacillus senegalensis]|uniref:C45 family autoproteolytic acyltransferase/hydolase n=1 Tax=Oceanobacillus senegalensis TaxID=1936063 RepID=UPI000A312512|nr:C45 family peptidase [Oceanobacillus senegalensis]
MRKIYSDIIQFRGNHYDFGHMQGMQLKDSLIVKNRKKAWKLRRPRFSVNEQETKSMLLKFAPGIWEELLGLRDALNEPMENILRDYSGYRIEPEKSGCSIYTSTDFMVRNYDYHPKTYEGRFSFFGPSDSGYAVVGPQQRITGRMDGMNECGLVMGYNSIHRKKPKDGFICHMIGRIILETCANVGEAIDLLKEIPHRHSFSYVLLDTDGVTKIVEASPRSVQVRESNMCTNHFELQKDENKRYLKDSEDRLEAIMTQQEDATDIYRAFRMMNDTDKGVFSMEYKNWAGTIHTSAYLPKEKKVWFALGGDQEPIIFNFEKWLQGDDETTKQIHGQIDTNLKFAHLD